MAGTGPIRLVRFANERTRGRQPDLWVPVAVKRSREAQVNGGSLPRYFFHVIDGALPIEDDQGTLFAGPSDAIAHAEVMANDLAQDEDQYRGHVIVVVDDHENVIARIPIVRRTH